MNPPIIHSSLSLRNKTIFKHILRCQKGHWTTSKAETIPDDFKCATCAEIAQIESRNKRLALNHMRPAFKLMKAEDIAWVKEEIKKP